MHPVKPLLLIGIGAAAATAENDPTCSPVSTIFITVPASPTAETICALSEGSAATVGIDALVDGLAQVTSTVITKTVTTSLVSTQIVSVIQASSPSEGQAAYSFTEDNGTTTWLGATPPASGSLITSTQVVTMQPVPPGYVAPSVEVTPITSYLTVSSTETLTETHTETQTLTLLTASASAGAYTGLASNGWNSSMSTLVTVKSPTIRSITIADKLAQYSGTAYPMIPSGARENAMHHNKIRDIAEIISATIDNVVVSWTDNYDSTPLSSSDMSPIVVPVTATTSQSDIESSPTFSPTSSPLQTESGSPTAPTTIGVSGSNVVSTLSPTSTSSSSAVQQTSGTLSSPLRSNTVATLSVVATATAPSCGDASADFIIDFDDLPAFSAGPGDTDIPPIFNPYHKLFFQEYFGYAPPPSDPFPPISPPQLAVYPADGSETTGVELMGEIGSGPRALESAFWIDAYSAYLGCTNAGPDDCSIMVKGYQNTSLFSIISQGYTLPPCPGLKNCSLALVEFNDGFRNLSGLQIIATVGTTRVDWYMDNLSLGWSNNTCAAQLERSSQE